MNCSIIDSVDNFNSLRLVQVGIVILSYISHKILRGMRVINALKLTFTSNIILNVKYTYTAKIQLLSSLGC